MSLLEDVVERQKKDAQEKFKKEQLRHMSKANNIHCGTVTDPMRQHERSNSPACSVDDEIEREKREAQSKYMKQYMEDISAQHLSIGSTRSAVQSEVLSKEDACVSQECTGTLSSAVSSKGVDRNEKVPSAMADDAAHDLPRMHPAAASGSDIRSNDCGSAYSQDFSVEPSQDLGESSYVSEEMSSLSDFKAFIEEEDRDMEIRRAIQQTSLNSYTEMDGYELPSGLWSIAYAYPHHVDSQYALGRPITTSLRSDKETEEDPQGDQQDECD